MRVVHTYKCSVRVCVRVCMHVFFFIGGGGSQNFMLCCFTDPKAQSAPRRASQGKFTHRRAQLVKNKHAAYSVRLPYVNNSYDTTPGAYAH